MKKNLLKRIKISLAGAVLGVLPFMTCPANASDTLPKFHQLTVLKYLDENAYQNFRFINKKAGDVMDLQHEKLNINERNILYKELLYGCTDLEIVNFLKKQYLSSAKIQEGRGTVYLSEKACDLLLNGRLKIDGKLIDLNEYIKGDTHIYYCSRNIGEDGYLRREFLNKRISKLYSADVYEGQIPNLENFPSLRELKIDCLNLTEGHLLPNLVKQINSHPSLKKVTLKFLCQYARLRNLTNNLEKIEEGKNVICVLVNRSHLKKFKLLEEKGMKIATSRTPISFKSPDIIDKVTYLTPVESLFTYLKETNQIDIEQNIESIKDFIKKYGISKLELRANEMENFLLNFILNWCTKSMGSENP